MINKRDYPPTHPGEILLEEFLKPMEVSQYRLAKDISFDPRRINEIIHGKRSISADTALRLGRRFGVSARFWLNLQSHYDLEVEEQHFGRRLEKEVATIEPPQGLVCFPNQGGSACVPASTTAAVKAPCYVRVLKLPTPRWCTKDAGRDNPTMPERLRANRMGDIKMRSRNFIQTLLIGVMLTACSAETPKTADTQDEVVPDEAETVEVVEYLFVQHAESVTLEDGLLTLEGIGADVLYFSDRPHRIVGRKTVEWFVEAWDEGEDSFATTPPNAVLTVKKEQELVDLTLVLEHPVLTDRTLVYTVEVLDGPESGIGDSAALFIDAFVKDLVRGGVKKEAGRAASMRGRLRGGGGGRGGRGGRPGDPNLPRDPGGGRGAREVQRGGSRQGAEIR